jgi:hypothetical protein
LLAKVAVLLEGFILTFNYGRRDVTNLRKPSHRIRDGAVMAYLKLLVLEKLRQKATKFHVRLSTSSRRFNPNNSEYKGHFKGFVQKV